MVELKALRCTECGGHIDPHTKKCIHCGTQYIIYDDYGAFKVERIPVDVVKLRNEIKLPVESNYRDIMDESFQSMLVRQIAQNFADKLVPFINYSVEIDPMQFSYTVHGEIGVTMKHD